MSTNTRSKNFLDAFRGRIQTITKQGPLGLLESSFRRKERLRDLSNTSKHDPINNYSPGRGDRERAVMGQQKQNGARSLEVNKVAREQELKLPRVDNRELMNRQLLEEEELVQLRGKRKPKTFAENKSLSRSILKNESLPKLRTEQSALMRYPSLDVIDESSSKNRRRNFEREIPIEDLDFSALKRQSGSMALVPGKVSNDRQELHLKSYMEIKKARKTRLRTHHIEL